MAVVVAGFVATACAVEDLTARFRLTDIAASAGLEFRHQGEATGIELVYGTGAALADCDGDGWLDVFVTSRTGPNALFRNDGDGTFTDESDRSGLADPNGDAAGAAFADYDNDGMPDLYVARFGANQLYHNLGDCVFEEVSAAAGVAGDGRTESIAWGDVDADGWVDLYYTNHTIYSSADKPPALEIGRCDRLFHNDGDGTFSDVSSSLGDDARQGAGFAAIFFDPDLDGDDDLYLVNDHWEQTHGNYFWENRGARDGEVLLTEMSGPTGLYYEESGMGVAAGDTDNDGDLDVTFSNIGQAPFLENDGAGVFVEKSDELGLALERVGCDLAVSWGIAMVDFDNDGWLDLYYAMGGTIWGGCDWGLPNAIYRNRGDGTFENVNADNPGALETTSSRTVARGDIDNDGAAELVVVGYDTEVALLDPPASDNGWLIVDLEGTRSNRDGIGSLVTVEPCAGPTMVREVRSGSSLGAGNDVAAYFGLGTAACVARVRVRWPDGTAQEIADVAANRRITIRQK